MPEAAEAALGCIVLLDPVSLGSGVEHLALTKSRATHPLRPRIEYLETRAQYQALEDGVSDDVWEEAVSWMLDNPSSFKTLLESSYDAWIVGDFEAIDRISLMDSLNRFEAIKEANINARNRLWLPTICELAESANEPTLVLVGAAHLGSADGFLPLLAGRGLGLPVASLR